MKALILFFGNPILQYNQFREKSAYLSDGGDRHLFFFLKNELDVQARRISNMDSKRHVRTCGESVKSPRKKSSVQRASKSVRFTQIFDGMSSFGKLSCLSRLSDVLDWRLCYFMSVFLATRKFIGKQIADITKVSRKRPPRQSPQGV